MSKHSLSTLRVAGILFLVTSCVGGALVFGNPQAKDTPAPLRLEITMDRPRVCLGAQVVTIQADLKNTSHGSLAVDPEALHYAYHIRAVPKVGEMELIERGSRNDGVALGVPQLPRGSIILKAGDSLKRAVELNLDEAPFFKEARDYRVRVEYGQFFEGAVSGVKLFHGIIHSNEFLFKAEDCKR